MDAQVFDALFARCKVHIRSSLNHQREVLAIALHWIGTASTCRSQEVIFDLAYWTVHGYRIHGVYAIVEALHTTSLVSSDLLLLLVLLAPPLLLPPPFSSRVSSVLTLWEGLRLLPLCFAACCGFDSMPKTMSSAVF
ncbi:hypothetical protein GN244_ATG05770 [Phytophthora infestans]|uniref:Uncharacterized protein n=1 Tax=Phytophthora infestans TaxID=4787 RepID=A0A833WY17_PHYIN|nr:hypothetical protein GN244_ATG05770 [Phytophthora infestans]